MFEYRRSPLSPQSAEIQWIEEALQLQQAAQEFRLEVEKREVEAQYCQWYYDMAQQTQAEVAAMENDVNFFSWFCGTKRQKS